MGLVTAADRDLLWVVFNKCEHWKVAYIYTARVKLLEWYNGFSGRHIHIGTMDRMIRRLREGLELHRTWRCRNYPGLGYVVTSSLSTVTRLGLSRLKRRGVDAFNIMKEISLVVRPRKKRARPEDPGRAEVGTMGPINGIVQGLIKGIKGL